ncbi:MAG: murein biosynthesis integral membrane protein MurJ [Bryobacterales bacterium]|nr:murein biosynthesis integral membrane protein MurJ [Bryobacterales bacterium]
MLSGETGAAPARADSARQEHARIVRSAGIVSGAVALSRVTGLLREVVMATLFGAGPMMDAFILAFRIPNLMRDLFAEGALSSAFVPTFTQYLAERGKRQAALLAQLVSTAIILFVGGICLLGMLFTPQFVNLLASEFHAVPGKYEMAVSLTRIMFPFLLLVSLAAQAMGILNACNQFAVPALASSFFNVGSLAFGLTLGYIAGPSLGITPIEGMAYGVVLGGALQLFWQMPSLTRSGFSFGFQIDWQHPGLRHVMRLMGPAILGGAAVQVNVMVNTALAASVMDPLRGASGPISWLGYAFRFMQLPLGLFGVAIASATLPSISRSAAKADYHEFRETLSRSLGLVFLLTIPSSIGLALLGDSMIGAIYEGGRFVFYDTQQTAIALKFYALGLVGYAATKILAPAFYAIDDARFPMWVSLSSIVTNFVVAYTMVKVYNVGFWGLALSTSVVATVSFLVLFIVIRNRLQGVFGRRLLNSFLRICAAAGVMGAVCWLSSSTITSVLGVRKIGYLTDVAVSVPLGLLAYVVACHLLGVTEIVAARHAVADPLKRILQGLRDRMRP